MPRALDRRIEFLDGQPGEYVATLRPGFAYMDANHDYACHVLGGDTKAEIRREMKFVRPCTCWQCRGFRSPEAARA